MHTELIIKLCVFLPLLGALIAGLLVRVISDRAAQFITSGLLVGSGLCAAFIFKAVALAHMPLTVPLVEWIHSGNFSVSWALRVDALTAVMLVVVTWVSSVVHLYSIGYMSHDEHKPRFMCYLSLFTFAMLMLVTSDNLVQLFFGWEGVGVCSYLLIGFWFKKPAANAAAMKAFIVNRVGDFGFALGIAATFLLFGSVSFDYIFSHAPDLKSATFDILGTRYHAITVICILLFIGAMGKSAQIGLHTWLPDAMEGPTPVSALIHAATMVTAGVFLVARCSPLFELSEDALTLVTYVGAITAIFAATIGLVQNDIKRVIAYSTCSQLGYMFFACGVSAYSAGVFHLMTHAFFKALLFLGAGSVIHAMSGEQDMRRMGGIWKLIPTTYAFMWIGSLALAGIPLFAGYYSKDGILEAAYAAGTESGHVAYYLGVTAAFFTAFYSWRLLLMTFHGTPRASHEIMHHVHESPPVMLLPLLLLVGGAIGSGYIGYHWLGMLEPDGHFWNGALLVAPGHEALENMHHVESWVKTLPLVAAGSGIVLAFVFYSVRPGLAPAFASIFAPLHTLFLNKYYVDEIYDALFVRGAKKLGSLLWKWGDEKMIDGLGPNGSAWLTLKTSQGASRLQTGYLYHYAFAMLLGLLLLVSWLFLSISGIIN